MTLEAPPSAFQPDTPPSITAVEFTNGGTVLDRRDDKVTFTLTDDVDAGQNLEKPVFQVLGLERKSESLYFGSPSSGTNPLVKAALVTVALDRGYRLVFETYQLGDYQTVLSLEAAPGIASDLAELATALKANPYFASNTLIQDIRPGTDGKTIEIVWKEGVQSSNYYPKLESSWLAPYVSPYGAGLPMLLQEIDAQVLVEGAYDSMGNDGVKEKQQILLPAEADIKAGATYLLQLPSGSSLKTAPLASGGATALLAALEAEQTSKFDTSVDLTLVTLAGGVKALDIVWKWSGSISGVARIGQVVQVTPTPTTTTNEWQISRTDLEAAGDLMGSYLDFAGLSITATEGYDDDELPDSSPTAVLVFPDLDIATAIRPTGTVPTTGYSEGTSAEFVVDLATAIPAGEPLSWRILFKQPSENSMGGTASVDDFVAASGAVTVDAAAKTGAFTIQFGEDAAAEPKEEFGIQVGHMEDSVFVADLDYYDTRFRIAASDPALSMEVGADPYNPSVQSLKVAVLGTDLYSNSNPVTTWSVVRAGGALASLPSDGMPYVSSYGGSKSVDLINSTLLLAGITDAAKLRVTYDPDGSGAAFAELSKEIAWTTPAPRFTLSSAAPVASEEGDASIPVTVSWTGDLPANASLYWLGVYGSSAGSADSSDFPALQGSQFIDTSNLKVGDTSLTFNVSVIDDAIAEGTETFQIFVGTEQNGFIAQSLPLNVSIAESDQPVSPQLPTITVTGPSSPVDERGGGAQFSVSLGGPLPAGVQLHWRVMPGLSGDAAEAADFSAIGGGSASLYPEGALSFATGSTIASVTVSMFDDALVETSPETFSFEVGTRAQDGSFQPIINFTASIAPSDESGGGGNSGNGPDFPAWIAFAESQDGFTIKPAAGSGVASLKFQALWSDGSDPDALPDDGPFLTLKPEATTGFVSDVAFGQELAALTKAGKDSGGGVFVRPTISGVRVMGLDAQGVQISDKIFDVIDAVSFNLSDGVDSRGIRVFDEDSSTRNPSSIFASRAVAFSDSDGHGNQLVYATGTPTNKSLLTDQVAITLPEALRGVGALNGVELQAQIENGAKNGDALSFRASNLFSIDPATKAISFLPEARYTFGTGAPGVTPATNAVVIGALEGDGTNASPLVVTFNSAATPEHVDLLAAALSFSTSLGSGSSSQAWASQAGTREISVSLHVGDEEIGWDSRRLEFVSVNDAPLINGSIAERAGFNAIASDWVQSAWDYVGSGIARAGWRSGESSVKDGDSARGPSGLDGDLIGVAVVGATSSVDGTWQYWADTTTLPPPGATTGWEMITAVSDSSALLLARDTPVRFVPGPNFAGGEPALNLRAWDGTGTGANGQPLVPGNRVDVSGWLDDTMGSGLVVFGTVPTTASGVSKVLLWRDLNKNGAWDGVTETVATPSVAADRSWTTGSLGSNFDTAIELFQPGIRIQATGLDATNQPIEQSLGLSLSNLTIPFSPNFVKAELPVAFKNMDAVVGTNTVSLRYHSDIATTVEGLQALKAAFALAIDPNVSDVDYTYAPRTINSLAINPNAPYELVITVDGPSFKGTDILRLSYQPASGSTGLMLKGADKVLAADDVAAVAFEETFYQPYVQAIPGHTVSGRVVDGYLSNAVVFADADGDAQRDDGEAFTSTAADGSFVLQNAMGPIIAYGGIDTSTGLPFNGGLMALPGGDLLTPLTTVVAAYMKADPALSREQALVDISKVTGISKDLLTKDVYGLAASDPAALEAQKFAAQIATLIQVAVSMHDGAIAIGPDPSVAQGLITGLVGAIEAAVAVPGGKLDPSSPNFVSAVLAAAGGLAEAPTTGDFVSIVGAVVNVNEAIAQAEGAGTAGLESIVRLQAVLQSAVLPDIENPAPFNATKYSDAGLVVLADQQTVGALFPLNPIDGSFEDDVIEGEEGPDDILALDGDDTIFGFGGDDLLSGGSGDDSMFGGDGSDRASDVEEGDIFIGGLGSDLAAFAGGAADYIVQVASESQKAALAAELSEGQFGFEPGLPVYVVSLKSGSTGFATVQAEQFQFGTTSPVDPASLLPGAPPPAIRVGAGGTYTTLAAAITAAKAGDSITVLAGHVEALPVIVTKNDLRIDLGASGDAINFKLEDSAPDSVNPVLKLTLAGARAANVVGNAHDNLIVGNQGVNVIEGLGGNDRLLGRGGDDELQGGSGNDWLDGGEGWDRLFGGSGNDRLFADEGGSSVSGGSGTDLLSGGSGNDMLIVATDDASKVQLLGGSGNDLYRFANFDDGSEAGGPRALHLNAFIADLTQGDGIDMGGFRSGAGPTPMGPLKSANPVSGDRAFDFGSGSMNAGLKAVGLGKGAGDAPVVSESTRGDVLGSLKVALAGELEVNDAIGRGSNATTGLFAESAGFESINTLLTNMNPVYSMLP